jgi:hypothetical protein
MNEIIINHIKLLTVTESMLQRNVNTESSVEKTIHKLRVVKYTWDGREARVLIHHSYINKYRIYGIIFYKKKQD